MSVSAIHPDGWRIRLDDTPSPEEGVFAFTVTSPAGNTVGRLHLTDAEAVDLEGVLSVQGIEPTEAKLELRRWRRWGESADRAGADLFNIGVMTAATDSFDLAVGPTGHDDAQAWRNVVEGVRALAENVPEESRAGIAAAVRKAIASDLEEIAARNDSDLLRTVALVVAGDLGSADIDTAICSAAPAATLTQKQHTVLSTLVRRKRNDPEALTCAEVGKIVFRGQRRWGGIEEWAGSSLRELKALGLATNVGKKGSARTWAPTDAGRVLLVALDQPERSSRRSGK